jgi:hypothetical protein
MNTLAVEIRIPYALNVSLIDDALSVDLSDRRRISAPIDWFPRLFHSSKMIGVPNSLKAETIVVPPGKARCTGHRPFTLKIKKAVIGLILF